MFGFAIGLFGFFVLILDLVSGETCLPVTVGTLGPRNRGEGIVQGRSQSH